MSKTNKEDMPENPETDFPHPSGIIEELKGKEVRFQHGKGIDISLEYYFKPTVLKAITKLQEKINRQQKVIAKWESFYENSKSAKKILDYKKRITRLLQTANKHREEIKREEDSIKFHCDQKLDLIGEVERLKEQLQQKDKEIKEVFDDIERLGINCFHDITYEQLRKKHLEGK